MKTSEVLLFVALIHFSKEALGTSTENDADRALQSGPKLSYVGNPPNRLLGVCEGDCDNDDECEGALRCFQRNDTSERVPGCVSGGNDDRNFDVCYDESGTLSPTDSPIDRPSSQPTLSLPPTEYVVPILKFVGNPRRGFDRGSLGLCEGDCDDDDDCEGDLKCFERDDTRRVPGCSFGGEDSRTFDVCYDETGTLAPTKSPTSSPSSAPSISNLPSVTPTTPPTPIPRLKYQGNTVERLLGMCEGNCDVDSDCKPGLICFERRFFYTRVPGCARGGDDYSEMNVCFEQFPSKAPTVPPTDKPTISAEPSTAPTVSPTDYPKLTYIGNPATNLGLCEGDCDTDADCQGSLQCFQRDSRRDEVPGCSKSDKGSRSFDVCFQPLPSQSPSKSPVPSVSPSTSTPTLSSKPTSKPTPDPTAEHFSGKVMEQMKYFQLKQYWRKGYYWQESRSEKKWCAETKSSRRRSAIQIKRCSGSQKKQRWRFYKYNRYMIESYYAEGMCIRLDGSRLKIARCDVNDRKQLWDWEGKNDKKFEWHPLQKDNSCVTNEHHPTSGEELKIQPCRRAKGDETGYWTVYD